MSEVRLIDANALKYKNLAEVNGRLTYVLTAEEIDNAPTVPQITICCENADEKTIEELKAELERVIHEVRPPQGRWITEDKIHCLYYCSECRCSGNRYQPFCGWCGAQMKGNS